MHSTDDTSTSPAAHPVDGALARLARRIKARRVAARNERELAAILAGHRGTTIREEVLAVMDR